MTYEEVHESDYPVYGLYKNFDGIVVTIEENGDLIFHCGSRNKAKKVIHSLFPELFLKKEDTKHDND